MSVSWDEPHPAPPAKRRLAAPRPWLLAILGCGAAALVALAIGSIRYEPIADAGAAGWGSTPTSSAFGFGIVNTGRLDIVVTGIDLQPVLGVFSSPRVEVGEPGAFIGDIGEPRRPFEAFTLAAGETRAIILSGTTNCTATRRGQYTELRAIDVRYTVLGLPKTQTLPLSDFRLNPTPEVCDPPPPKPYLAPPHGRM